MTGTLFIANRGEIARRIARSARDMGMRVVIPTLDGPGSVDLLDADDVVRAAREAGATMLHPGYGFLAESPALAAAVLAAAITWVGPGPEAIAALGDKPGARRLATRAGVPVAAGIEPDDQADAALLEAAGRLGLPLVVKPAAGGGGKGIRVVRSGSELPGAIDTSRREAARAFGDPHVLFERYLDNARHVEVQVLADAHGGLVHLGDRDCSLQRRHQKILEEAPAPALADDVRRQLRDAAARLAASVGYVGAGTCEFLVTDDGDVAFLEMNARLQVEHPVTELVTGRDVVADQLAIAGGARLDELGLEQATIDARLAVGGHAIEVRLNAEDPATGFLPTSGRVVDVRWPAGSVCFGPVGRTGVRVDAGVVVGDEVTGRFDPLLAKVIAWGPDRPGALARLAEALDATELLGVTTNLSYLRRLVRQPVVVDGRARITSLEEDETLRAVAAEAVEIPDGSWRAVAGRLAQCAGDGAWAGGWRLNQAARLRVEAELPDERVSHVVELAGDAGDIVPVGPPMAPDGDRVHVSVEGRSVPFGLAPPPALVEAALAGAAAHGLDVRAPMPGTVLAVHVRRGDTVVAGDRIATLEAMKMEHAVTAPGPGRIADLLVTEGRHVERGALVARLEPPA